MTSKFCKIFGCVACAASLAAPLAARADDEDAAKPSSDEELKGEIAYVEALIDNGFPDFAAPVIEATKKRWPESEAQFFALEVRGLLLLGKFEDAERKIASLPDRKGSKFWAARLEMANYYFMRDRKKECSAIYDEFFKTFANPPKELKEFYMQACYSWGQILVGDKRFEEAAGVYAGLLKQIDRNKDEDSLNIFANISCETAEMYLKLAADTEPGPGRNRYLTPAAKIVNDMLWLRKLPVYFGRAIAMMAHIELLKGNVQKAQDVIDEYMDQLSDIHDSLVDFDPDGRKGALKMSPMPLCRYLLADMLWNEAKEESKKPARNDERIRSLMFGPKVNGVRNGEGAYNHALNVFIQYPESIWSADAGELAEEIRAFAEKTYKAKIKTSVTAEQMAKVHAMQFRSANEKMGEGKFEEAAKDYLDALSHSPEGMESVVAVDNLISCYRNLFLREQDEAKKDEWRLYLDAVEGYLGERFASARDRRIMTTAGDCLQRAAAAEKQAGDLERAKRLYGEFFRNYRRHVNAGNTLAALAQEAYVEKDYATAMKLFEFMGKAYTNNTYYASSLQYLSQCYKQLGDRVKAIDALKRYVEVEPNPLNRDFGRMNLAQLYKEEGFEILAGAETNETAEAVTAQMKAGSAQIVRGIQQFKGFADRAEKALANPGLNKADRDKYTAMREAALFLVGDSWRRMTKPEDKLELFRKKAAEEIEGYVEKYPEGKFAKAAYVSLGTIYTALGDMEKTRSALDRLSSKFPDSDEAKNAKPRLAKNLMEMGLKKEGTELYAEMLHTDGAYVASQFLAAGNALIEARSWELANQAFEKAISTATNSYIIARARLGEAKALFKQGSFAEAREAIDLFLGDEKMSKLSLAVDANFLLVEVASEQGRTEQDATMRGKYFGAAVGALNKVRAAWAKRPRWEQDQLMLMSADIYIRRAKAEEAMGLKEEALESRKRAVSTLQVFLQTREIGEANPRGKLEEGDLANLQRCYETIIPICAMLGSEHSARVIKLGQDYLNNFPEGGKRTEILNFINQAKADVGDAPIEAEEPASTVSDDEELEADEPEAEEPAAEEAEPEGDEADDGAPAAEDGEKPAAEEAGEAEGAGADEESETAEKANEASEGDSENE